MTLQLFRRLRERSGYRRVQARYHEVFNLLKDFTMIPREAYIANLELAQRFSCIQGAIVECGTWRGGMIAGIGKLLGPERSYYLFDSFEGLPPAKEIDGAAAIGWQSNTSSATYHNNCTASEEDAATAMKRAGINSANITKGWFSNTLSTQVFPDGISILRMDADWYDSTMDILNNLFRIVNPGGVLIIDDYHTWDGCSKAVHDFLSKGQLTERISMHNGICFIQKK